MQIHENDVHDSSFQTSDVPGEEEASGARQNDMEPESESPIEIPKIDGFDSSARLFLKEPTFYISVAIVLIASALTLGDKPLVFGVAFGFLLILAITLHIIAERFLFSGKKENRFFRAPGEGLFVLTFGSIVPGLSLLAYAAYATCTTEQPNYLLLAGKIALLLLVPTFNFAVWKALRKGYLPRPRLTGLMNGVAAGLSASWTVIWIKCLLDSQTSSYCKFGWLLLLFMSPLMLFAAVCMALDLWKKTSPRISLISTIFSSLGCVLSLSFVFAPIGHSLFIQAYLADAKSSSPTTKAKALSTLRGIAKKEDLNPAAYPVSDLGLAELLIPNRGLNAGAQADKNLFFEITGVPFEKSKSKKFYENNWNADYYFASSVIGEKLPGLSMSRSQITGSVDAASLTSSLNWTMIFHNSSQEDREARAEIQLPAGAVVSRVTLWVDGKPQEAAFAPSATARSAYQEAANRAKDPLLVSMSGRDRIFVQCYPVPSNRGEMKIRLGIKAPLNPLAKTCTLRVPRLLETNFSNPIRHRIHLDSSDRISAEKIGTCASKPNTGFSFEACLRDQSKDVDADLLSIDRPSKLSEFSVVDWYSHGKQFITEKIQQVNAFTPKKLIVVLDSSGSVRPEIAKIKAALSSLPKSLSSSIYLAPSEDRSGLGAPAPTEVSNGNSGTDGANAAQPKKLDDAIATLQDASFVGGHSNDSELREALDSASERADSAVLWIHGPQPLAGNALHTSALDLIHNVHLYDFEIQPGANVVLQNLYMESCGSQISYMPVSRKGTAAEDLKALFDGWKNPEKKNVVVRSVSDKRPSNLVSDSGLSAQITSLWAKAQVEQLIANGMRGPAERLGTKYRLISSVTGAVVLANPADYDKYKLDPGSYENAPEGPSYANTVSRAEKVEPAPVNNIMFVIPSAVLSSPGGGLVGAPVDPRYGQSNQVGALADYGYDTARDISRLLTSLSLIVSIIFGTRIAASGKQSKRRGLAIAKGVAFAFGLPTIIHLIGTFAINNYGGLGGGL